jgi:hypothetical protein
MPIDGLPDPAKHRRKRRLVLYGVLALALLWAVVKEAGWL